MKSIKIYLDFFFFWFFLEQFYLYQGIDLGAWPRQISLVLRLFIAKYLPEMIVELTKKFFIVFQ